MDAIAAAMPDADVYVSTPVLSEIIIDEDSSGT